MGFMIIPLIILVSVVPPSLQQVKIPNNEWFHSASDIIRMKCDGLDHDVEIAWNKFGELALSIPDTKMDGIVRLTKLATGHRGEYQCIARIYRDTKLVAAARITIQPPSSFSSNNNGGLQPPENFQIPSESKINCQAAGSDEPSLSLEWGNLDYSPVSRRTTVAGSFSMTPDAAGNPATEYTCSGWDSAHVGCSMAKTYVEMISPPKIRLLPDTQSVQPGESPSIICLIIGGDRPITTEWYAIGRILPADSWDSVTGVLKFDKISADAAGKYVCNATNEAGSTAAVFQVINDDSHCI